MFLCAQLAGSVLALLTLVWLMASYAGKASTASLTAHADSDAATRSALSPAATSGTGTGSAKRSSTWSDLTPPLSRESLGQATWSFLHTLAAMYPVSPTPSEQRAAELLLGSLALLYPCTECREHYTLTLEERPPRVTSRSALEQWLCETHNEVNARLGKELADCARVSELWPSELRECGCSADNATSISV